MRRRSSVNEGWSLEGAAQAAEVKRRRPWLWPAILTLIGVAVLAAAFTIDLLPPGEDEVRLPRFLTGEGAYVVLPADWQPHDVAAELPSADAVE